MADAVTIAVSTPTQRPMLVRLAVGDRVQLNDQRGPFAVAELVEPGYLTLAFQRVEVDGVQVTVGNTIVTEDRH